MPCSSVNTSHYDDTINIRSLNTHYRHGPNAFPFGLKSTRITTKLTFSPGSSLQEKQSLP